jgi:hypothetical protein
MKKVLAPVVVIVILMLPMVATGPAEAEEPGALAVFITYEYGDYEVGSEVTVTVHVFDRGEYADPADVNLTLVERWVDVPLTKAEVGRYEGTFAIEFDDLYHSLLRLRASATHSDGSVASDRMTLYTVYSRFFVDMVWLSHPRWVFSPGEEVEIEIRTSLNDRLVDADEGTAKLRFHIQQEATEYIEATRMSKGRYKVSFMVPSDVESTPTYWISATAEHTVRIDTPGGMRDLALSNLDTDTCAVRRYNVWLHVISIDAEEADLELFVHDVDWVPVEGADVDIGFYGAQGGWQQFGSTEGTTDAEGRVAFSVDVADLDSLLWAVAGTIDVDGEQQTFEQSLYDHEMAYYYLSEQNGMSATALERPGVVGSKGRVKVRLGSDTGLLPEKEVYSYYVTDHEILGYSKGPTDSDGVMTHTFDRPTEVRWRMGDLLTPVGHYHSIIDGGRKSVEMEYQIIDKYPTDITRPLGSELTRIETGRFLNGGDVEVRLISPYTDGTEEHAAFIWGVGPDPSDWVTNLEWNVANTEYDPMVGGFVNCEWEDGAHVGTLRLPPFLPAGTEIHIGGYITVLDGGRGLYFGPFKTYLIEDPDDPAPTCTVESPADGKVVGPSFQVKGSASDDTGVLKVEVRVDEGAWQEAEGVASWRFEISDLAPGNHTIEVRSYDGSQYSRDYSVTVTVEEDTGPTTEEMDDSRLWLIVIVIVIIVLLMLVLIARRRVTEERPPPS